LVLHHKYTDQDRGPHGVRDDGRRQVGRGAAGHEADRAPDEDEPEREPHDEPVAVGAALVDVSASAVAVEAPIPATVPPSFQPT